MKIDLSETEIRFLAIMIAAGMSSAKEAAQTEIVEHIVGDSLHKIAESINEKFIKAVTSSRMESR